MGLPAHSLVFFLLPFFFGLCGPDCSQTHRLDHSASASHAAGELTTPSLFLCFIKGCLKNSMKQENCDPQNLKYSISGPLQKMFERDVDIVQC
jgi:hypothetical protein